MRSACACSSARQAPRADAAALALLEATHEVSAALARCEQTLGSYREDGSGPGAPEPVVAIGRALEVSDGQA